MKNLVYKSILFTAALLFISSCKDATNKAVYEGQDLSEKASILRDKETKSVVLTINTEGAWTLYAGKSTDKINYDKTFSGSGKGVFPIDVDSSYRSYFQLVTDEGKTILAESHLPMQGGYNFRDLGGIKNKEGKYVKWGKLFRTDDLGKLTESDLQYLSSIPITSVVDFRTKDEIKANPDKLPSSVKSDYELNISPGNLNLDLANLNSYSKLNFDSVMIEMNKDFVTDTVIINQYRRFFEVLQNESNAPVIFHCSAGKDRTGMGAALILFALGVDEDTIMKDYLLSNKYLGDKYKDMKQSYPFLTPMFVVKRQYLQTSIDLMKEKYGSVDNYLTKELEIDLVKFKQLYLY